MENKLGSFFHTFCIVIVCIGLYNAIKNIVPAPIVALIGL